VTKSIQQSLVGAAERLQARSDGQAELPNMYLSGIQRHHPIGLPPRAAGQADCGHASHGEVKPYEGETQRIHQGIEKRR
jgi:hypothetical protein